MLVLITGHPVEQENRHHPTKSEPTRVQLPSDWTGPGELPSDGKMDWSGYHQIGYSNRHHANTQNKSDTSKLTKCGSEAFRVSSGAAKTTAATMKV